MAITAATQELLTRVEGEAPMGKYLRANFWLPACRAASLVKDGAPKLVRLLGENFVAFRSTDGRLGFFPEACPHRGTSLTLARNEDNALRCIYHGWKYRVDGKTVEVPTQYDNHDAFCKKVPLKSFPIREDGGLAWVWLGDKTPAEFPHFEFFGLPEEQCHVNYQYLPYNWFQGIEGQVDSAHVTQLHQDFMRGFGGSRLEGNAIADLAPQIEFADFEGGFRYAAIRKMDENLRYIRVTGYTLPWYSYVPFSEGGTCVIHVPIDDWSTALYMLRYSRTGPLTPTHLNPVADPDNFPPYLTAGPEERYGQDRDLMKRTSFSGFAHHVIQEDFAVAASQGVIADRTIEFLNSADFAVIRVRRLLADAVKDWQDGQPVQIKEPELLACGLMAPEGVDWRNIDPNSKYVKHKV